MRTFNPRVISDKDRISVSELLKTSVGIEIGRFDANLSTDKELLDSALYNLLQKKEMVTSSKIEGTKVTFQQALMSDVSLDGGVVKKTEKKSDFENEVGEVLGLRLAIQKAEKDLRTGKLFSNETINLMHEELMQHAVFEQGNPGSYREFEVEVGEYEPPHHSKLEALMKEFEIYIQYQDVTVNPFVKVAIAHAYFEIIHPFGDGNGRIGRLLIPFLIHAYGITEAPSFFLSSYFEKNRHSYYRGLENIWEENGWKLWVEYFLKASAEHAKLLNRKSKDLFDLYRNPKFLALRTQNSQVIKNFIFQKPIFTIPSLTRYLKKEGEGNTHDLRGKLEVAVLRGDLEILQKGEGRKPTWYICPQIVNTIRE